MVWDVLGKVVQSNARFTLCDRLEVHLDIVKMHASNGKMAEKAKGRPLNVLSAIKRRFTVEKAAFLCMSHALIIAMARVNGDTKYELYRNGKCLKKPVEDLLEVSGVDLSNGGGLEKLQHLQA
jgi:hypothetical protein